MPQFKPSEGKTAKVMMRNPTGKAFDYAGFLYMGTDLAVMSQASFRLEAGQEKQISFPVIMPSLAGTYPVHIGIFSEGRNIALYRVTEDVVIVSPTLLDVIKQRIEEYWPLPRSADAQYYHDLCYSQLIPTAQAFIDTYNQKKDLLAQRYVDIIGRQDITDTINQNLILGRKGIIEIWQYYGITGQPDIRSLLNQYCPDLPAFPSRDLNASSWQGYIDSTFDWEGYYAYQALCALRSGERYQLYYGSTGTLLPVVIVP